MYFQIVLFRETVVHVGHFPALVPLRDKTSRKMESWFPCQSKTWLIVHQKMVVFKINNITKKNDNKRFCFVKMHVSSCTTVQCFVIHITPELRIFWAFPTYPGVQTHFCGVVLINAKFIKHFGHSIVNSRTP